MSTVLLSSIPTSADSPAIRDALIDAGFAVVPHALGSTPAVDFSPIGVAIVDVGNRVEVAAAQTRRWRIELGDDILPVLWLLPTASSALAIQALDAGADACLAQPLDADTLVAQVKALARTQASAARLGVKADESRLLGEQLRKAYLQLERELEMGRRIHRSFLPQLLPAVGAVRFSVCHRPRSRSGGDFFDVRRLDETHVGFFLGDVLGRGTSGSLLGVLAKQAANLKEITGNRYRLVPPEEVLVSVNRELIGLGLDDAPLVAMLVGSLNSRDGTLSIARAGLPAPVYVPANGEPHIWSTPGQFLGTSDTTYAPLRGTLAPGDKLLIGSDGTRPESDPTAPDRLLQAATRHRLLSGQAFVDEVARELLPLVQQPDDFTLMAVEMTG